MRRSNALFALCLTLAPLSPITALAESIDPAFGLGGRVAMYSEDDERTVGFHRLSDGRYIAVLRYYGPSCDSDPCLRVVRLNSDASRDLTFGAEGMRQYPLPLRIITDSAIDSQGRLVVVGSRAAPTDFANLDFSVVRIAANGDLDPTFNANGLNHVAFDLGGGGREYDLAEAVAIDADDNIIVVGTVDRSDAINRDFGATRLRGSDGQIDANFGVNGRVVIPFDLGGAYSDSATAVAVLPDGRIAIGGSAQQPSSGRTLIAIARIMPNGILDPSFCPNGCGFTTPEIGAGRRTYAFDGGSTSQILRDMLVRPDGYLAICGTHLQNPRKAAIALFDLGGAALTEELDGIVEAAECSRITLQSDGKLVIAGNTGLVGMEWRGLFVSRYTRDLQIDSSYAPAGSNFIYFTGSGLLFDEGPDLVGSLELDAGRALVGFDFVAQDGSDDAAALRVTSDLIFSNGLQVF